MPDASNSSSNSGPQGALIKCACLKHSLHRPTVLGDPCNLLQCALSHDGLSTCQVLFWWVACCF